MTRNLLAPLAFAVALAFGGGASARAGVIYSSFGPGMSYGNGNHRIAGPTHSIPDTRGYRFTAASDGQVASYDLALRTYSTSPAGAFTIRLVADAGGRPDFAAILDSATINLASIELTTIYNLTSSTGANLTAGVPYWILGTIAGNGRIDWKQGDPNLPSTPNWVSFTGLPEPAAVFNSWPGAFAINSVELATAPEPGSLALAASGTLVLAIVARSRRRH